MVALAINGVPEVDLMGINSPPHFMVDSKRNGNPGESAPINNINEGSTVVFKDNAATFICDKEFEILEGKRKRLDLDSNGPLD
uniref:Uncharacterized protein n=1 Tax=Cannabis sativa TaxID=3483 RepID=A0A803NKH9_CANSA